MNASFPLRALHISGLDPWDNSWFAKLRSFLTFITAFIVCITSIIEMITIEWHVDAIVPAVEAFVGSAQGLLRWYVCFFNKERMAKVLIDTKQFWNIDVIGYDCKKNIITNINMVKRGMIIYIACVFSTGSVAVIIPILFNGWKVLPFKVWIPDKNIFLYGFEILYITQLVYLLTTVCLVLGVDILYGIFCSQLLTQFKLLNKKFEQIGNIKTNKDFIKNLEDGISYHVKLIEFADNLGYIYFSLFLCQYVITLSGSCVELYRISESLSDISKISRFATYMISLFIQMGMYCFLAEAVMEESEKTALAVYTSDWYSKDIKEVGIYLRMIIMRAQKIVTFSGGGFFVIGRVLFFNVFKLSFSVFTLLTSSK